MKIRSKHWKIFPIIIILYSQEPYSENLKEHQISIIWFSFFFVVCEAESHIVPFLQNRKVLMEIKFPLPENISLSLYSGSWPLPNLHKSSTCSFIYSSFHVFCKILWQSNYVLSTVWVSGIGSQWPPQWLPSPYSGSLSGSLSPCYSPNVQKTLLICKE